MDSEQTQVRAPCCLECGHEFSAAEIAAMTAQVDDDETCIIKCTSCGAHNIARSAPQPGLDKQPVLTVLRTAAAEPEPDDVFEETVEPGVRVHPISSGSSN